ncbi:hypothetical protein J7E55_02975 [Bacillus sp. ISL-53]|nr:hypothetical protein [Bacillus sp. ISL-53]
MTQSGGNNIENTLVQYGQTLQLVGRTLIYISNRMYPDFLDEEIRNNDQFSINLQNSISVGQSNLQCLETITPPKFIMEEHQLLVKAIKGLVDALEDLLRSINLKISLTIKETDLETEILNLRKKEEEVKVASREVTEKIANEIKVDK